MTDYTYADQRSEMGSFGLMYYRARWYDPSLGRFAQADTIVPEAGNFLAFDRYDYVFSNPLRYNDPSGRNPCYGINHQSTRQTCMDGWESATLPTPKTTIRPTQTPARAPVATSSITSTPIPYRYYPQNVYLQPQEIPVPEVTPVLPIPLFTTDDVVKIFDFTYELWGFYDNFVNSARGYGPSPIDVIKDVAIQYYNDRDMNYYFIQHAARDLTVAVEGLAVLAIGHGTGTAGLALGATISSPSVFGVPVASGIGYAGGFYVGATLTKNIFSQINERYWFPVLDNVFVPR